MVIYGEIIRYMKLIGFAICAIQVVFIVPQAMAANSTSATVNFKATVLADCFISVTPTSIDFGNLNASELGGKTTGNEITGHEKTITVTPNCYGTDSFTITYHSDSPDGPSNSEQCASDKQKTLGFCLRDHYMVNGTGSFIKKGGNTPFGLNIFLVKGSGNITPGDKTSAISLTIAPN